ncbi:lytic transglycosylase domain-containing protein [Thioclava litoralis]|uniref:Lytic transglycosylase domain-containing protein n=1 Tax=Thioclava litoralis TaxID=3076557 RepID=A0ABZ1E0J8_9RHOB|nr:lytic transglycosylase domain-containing protein [Thioclava sp. FTW29]
MHRKTLFAGLTVVVLGCGAGLRAEEATQVVRPSPEQALAQALALADQQDWPGAEEAARSAGAVAFDIIEWERLRAGEGSFRDYADFSARRHNWPGLPLLRRKGEDKLDAASPEQVIAYFAKDKPLTGKGALALIAAYQAKGQSHAAATEADRAWRHLDLSPEEQQAFQDRYGVLISPANGGRMQSMLDRGDLAQARRMLDLVTPGTRAVAAARIALQGRKAGVDALVEAVPEYMRGSYGLARDRAVWRWRESYEDGAADLILDWSGSAKKLGDPALWADVRRRMARWDMRRGDYRRAYREAANHHLPPGGSDYAELEWLAGYAALKLGDAPTALRHFEALSVNVGSPISQSRADYWRGRALEAMGRKEAADQAYQAGARYQTAYYGLLSAEKVGKALDASLIQPEALPDWRAGGYTDSSVFQAALLLHAAGDAALAERFVLHYEESLPDSRIAGLVDLALEWRDPHLALQLSKRAALNGEILVAGYFPFPELKTHDLAVPEELALSIARRESEFDHTVISYVGARGLMQLMPGTAKMMAARLGVEYTPAALTTDPTYNIRLGSEYLKQLRDEFGNSPLLVAAGYNAGPGRSRQWIKDMGDPRAPGADVVDWVEMIPFDETRNYVMRVAESLPIYRARLGEPAVPFSEELRGNGP